jgi:MOSC domain-containing protein YiiM
VTPTDSGTVEGIWIAEEGSKPMAAVESVEAVANRGLRGDRYFRGTGYYSGFDGCEVTLVTESALESIQEEYDIDLRDGRHRRNVVTRGVPLIHLLDTRFAVGDTVLDGTRPRPPCAHVEAVAEEDGVARALQADRGGICAHVVESGTVEVGDTVEVRERLTADPDELAEAIRDRHD